MLFDLLALSQYIQTHPLRGGSGEADDVKEEVPDSFLDPIGAETTAERS